MPAHDLTCPACYFVTSLPPAICPLCGTEMMEADGQAAAAESLVELPWIEPWLATEDPEPSLSGAETVAPAARATSAAP